MPLCRLKLRAEIARGLGREAKPKTAAERPAVPAEAPVSPAPSAADTRAFFRGGEAPPGSESLEEQAEARVTSLGTSVTRRPQTCLLLSRRPNEIYCRTSLQYSYFISPESAIAAVVIVCQNSCKSVMDVSA